MLRHTPLRTAASSARRIFPATTSRPSLCYTTRFLTTEPAAPTETLNHSGLHAKTAKSDSTNKSALTATIPRQLTYLVGRTKSNHVSVYNDQRSGGTRKETVIKKIEGNAQDLKKDLINELKFKKDDVNVNPVTGHVKIKGWHFEQVKTWLEARGF